MRTARYGLLFVGILLIGANLRTAITSVGPVLSDIRGDLGFSGATASILVGLPLIAFAVISPVAPVLATRFGMERTLGAALLLLAASIVARSLPLTGLIWVGTAGLGVAIALMNVILPSLIKRDYPSRVGAVTGAYSSVQSAAAAAASGFAVPIASVGHDGWRLAIGVWAGLAIITFAIFLPQLRRKTTPADAAPATRLHPHRSPWRASIAWQVTLFMGLQSSGYYALITWWPSIVRSQGVSAADAGWHLFLFQILGIAGNLGCAAVLNRARDQRLLAAVTSGFTLVGIVGQLLFPPLAVLWIMLAGVGCGSTIVLALSLFGLRSENHVQAGELSGMAQSVGYLIAALGPVLLGVLHDVTGTWALPLGVMAALVLTQTIAGLLAGRNRSVGLHP
ncbi:MFS transporter [Microbacterium sp. STN6]|uniref:CynX/NimT family MFS transporter n=1 Tax=Microbacterium sp. STN6 TaxID=2995588 RepID=UPI002260F36E|nr:MFS transporter [Microbacterium sp. STN6]MCX7522028.1 MFS transporter [Microbacterium sp. STN6]